MKPTRLVFLGIMLSAFLACSGNTELQSSAFSSSDAIATQPAFVAGDLIQFNDNGAWCWYQDERAIVDEGNQALIVGSIENGAGVGGKATQGNIDEVFLDLSERIPRKTTLKNAFISFGGGDDHNAPAVLALPNGSYLAFYAGHNNDSFSYYRVYSNGTWGPEGVFDWRTIPGGTDFNTTYSNLFYLSAEKRVYNIARGNKRSPNIIYSDDLGATWNYGGLLTQPDLNIGYVNGYFKYWSNGVDRIDFVGTEHHPRDFNTSIYHGYIKGGQSFDSFGNLKDPSVFDQSAPKPADFTQVFKANTQIGDANTGGATLTRAWTIDLQAYPDGKIATIVGTRANNNEMDHRFVYAIFDGKTWRSTYLCKAGPKLYQSEEDYTGLGAIDPADPFTIYVSTTFDPRDGRALRFHEIYRGQSVDEGRSWTWQAITEASSCDNLRPIVPKWGNGNSALLWFRGSYYTAQIIDAAIVGVLDEPKTRLGPRLYIDATKLNTTRAEADGNIDEATAPAWRLIQGFGNGGSVYCSSDAKGEDLPRLATTIPIDTTGTYDVWVNFWADPKADWRVKAGLAPESMQVYRQRGSAGVKPGDYSTPDGASPILVAEKNGLFLYQAYLGRVHGVAGSKIKVYIDDYAIQAGSSGPLVGNFYRTYYDGISIAQVVLFS